MKNKHKERLEVEVEIGDAMLKKLIIANEAACTDHGHIPRPINARVQGMLYECNRCHVRGTGRDFFSEYGMYNNYGKS